MRLNPLILLPLLALAACVPSKPEPVPQPKPQPVPPPVVIAPQPVRPAGEWVDWPIEPGTWVYRADTRGSLALFGPAGANATVTLRCDKARARIFLSVSGTAQGSPMVVRTSSTMKSLVASQASTAPPYVAAELLPRDAILDAIAYSRGRFAIEIAGLRPMAIPNWAEIGRVIEDCR
ncbi:MAG: hypothetical protein IPG54_07635 [Sphingomonadales bacterium]|jgi:hypothetical protein|nr:hypothetical protein [Sphingomonadales bacterium]MBK9002348.1 hypothetical protein [Sphingomonadales bacterium]MBK9267574.1 hypothetical protein [Sphingomonadales bacterium]MBP6433128.1 hypothetical protein [Sphingorhabdus sp.]